MRWACASLGTRLIGGFVWAHFTSTSSEGIRPSSRLSELLNVVGIVLFLTEVGEWYLYAPIKKNKPECSAIKIDGGIFKKILKP